MTKSAPSRAAAWSVVEVMVAPAPSASFTLLARGTIFSSGRGSMSSKTMWQPCSEGVPSRSASSSGLHW